MCLFQQINKTPKSIMHETPEIEFKLGMNIIFKDGTGKSKHVVYEGATVNGLKHLDVLTALNLMLIRVTCHSQIKLDLKIFHKRHSIIAKR